MNCNDMIKLFLSFHGAVLLAAIVALYKFGDRTEIYAKSFWILKEMNIEKRK